MKILAISCVFLERDDIVTKVWNGAQLYCLSWRQWCYADIPRTPRTSAEDRVTCHCLQNVLTPWWLGLLDKMLLGCPQCTTCMPIVAWRYYTDISTTAWSNYHVFIFSYHILSLVPSKEELEYIPHCFQIYSTRFLHADNNRSFSDYGSHILSDYM